MKNPFKFDIEVEGDYFCGRKSNIEDIVDFIENETNIVMFSKRRIGKSSLVKEVFAHHLEGDTLSAHVDIYAISNIRELYEYLKKGIEEAFTRSSSNLDRLARLVDDIRSYFHNAEVRLVVSAEPSIEIIPTDRDYYKSIEYLLYGLFNYLEANGRQCVIAIDEFQKIVTLPNSDKVEAMLRTLVNKRKNCSFIFTGSKRNLLLSLFNKSDRPFFKLGMEYHLGAIDFDEFYEWTKKRFERKKLFLDRSAFELLYDEADGETRFIQMVSYELFRRVESDTVITAPTMSKYINRVLEKKRDLGVLLDTYTSVQQNTLKLIAKSDGRDIYAKASLDEYDLNKSAAQSAVRSLKEKGIVFDAEGELQFEDVEFKLWLKRV